MKLNKSTRDSKITGNFSESLVLYWLSTYGFECALVDHTGIDIIAYNPQNKERIGISVKSRSRNIGKEGQYLSIPNPNTHDSYPDTEGIITNPLNNSVNREMNLMKIQKRIVLYRLKKTLKELNTCYLQNIKNVLKGKLFIHIYVLFLISILGCGSFSNRNNNELIIASGRGYSETLKELLANGVDPNFRTNDGVTPLFMAAVGGHTDIIKILLAHGADVNSKFNDGATALHIASSKGYTEIVKIVLSNGADVNAKTKRNETALDIASRKGHIDIVKILLKRVLYKK